MLNDLAMAIHEWQDEGKRIILLADMNDDVSGSIIQEFCRSVHLVEAIHYLHGHAAVLTHQQGSTAIGGIFLSSNLLEDAQGGFLSFGEVTISDHQAIWLDLPATLLRLEGQNQVTQPAGRRLKCVDPRIMHKYNMYLKWSIHENKVIQRIQAVYKIGVSQLTTSQLEQYNKLDQQYVEMKIAASGKAMQKIPCREGTMHTVTHSGHL